MSASVVRSAGEAARSAVVEAAWAQWSLLAPLAAAAGGARSGAMVDPEALVLASLAVRDENGRLADVLDAWAREGAWLLSVQRASSLARRFPEPVRERLSAFAAVAVEAGDRRWRRHASPAETGSTTRRKNLGPPRLTTGPALMLRLRAAFGVGVKADLLAVLLGLHGRAVTLRELSGALAYTPQALGAAAEEMSLSGFIQRLRTRPLTFRAEHKPWEDVLGTEGRTDDASTPCWRSWAEVFAFLAHVGEWSARAESEGWSPYVASSRARDLAETHAPALARAGIGIADPSAARGADYLEAFGDSVVRVCDWTRKHL